MKFLVTIEALQPPSQHNLHYTATAPIVRIVEAKTPSEAAYVTRFANGRGGTDVQLTIGGKYVQLTHDEASALAVLLLQATTYQLDAAGDFPEDDDL